MCWCNHFIRTPCCGSDECKRIDKIKGGHWCRESDIIGGFPVVNPNCAGCGKPLQIENAALTDGCPCNSPLGVNNMNETRWRLLLNAIQNEKLKNEKLQQVIKLKVIT